MAEAAIRDGEEAGAPAIDRAHLARMTFGDEALARELLTLFDRQAALILGRMRQADPATVATLAHTLKGSALGIGAGAVADAAATVERAPGGEGMSALAGCVERARLAIAAMLAPGAD